MAIRLNFTGRKKIHRRDVTIRPLHEEQRLTFDVDLRLEDYRLEPSARVYIEAYRSVSTLWKRFDFGRVGLLHPPADRWLDDFGDFEGILFRIKVVAAGEGTGRLIAEVDSLRPRQLGDEVGPGDPLIKPAPGDTGAELWRLRFDPDMPVLVINQRELGWKALVMQPDFRALVAPAAMRQILMRILVIEPGAYDEDDESAWQVRWLKFCERLPNLSDCPGSVDEEYGTTAENVEIWIDDAVSAFCAHAGLIDRFLELREREKSP